jgi:predicted KAP-like P-loop ATPase
VGFRGVCRCSTAASRATTSHRAALTSAVNADADGKPRLLAPWEAAAVNDEPFEADNAWNSPFVPEWLALPPALADEDLRGALYVGREQAPLITAADRLSSEAAALLTALLETPGMANAVKEPLEGIQRAELSIIMDRLLARARQEQAWGVPDILDGVHRRRGS